MDMQGLDFGGGLPVVTGRENSLAELDALDVDNLMNFFGPMTTPIPSFGDGAMFLQQQMLQQQLPPRTPTGSAPLFPDPPLAAPAANLFSSIPMPDFGKPATSSRPPADSDHSSDDAEGRSRGPDAHKTTAIQEKNRRAQKRFRERQKAKMKDMTEELDDMTSELGRLRVENGALKNRNSILEKVLALRDEHIRVLQDEQHVFDLGNHHLQTSNPKLLGPGPAAPAMLGYGAGGGGSGLQGGGLPGSGQGAGSQLPARGSGPLALSAALASEVASVKTMPADAVISRWKETVRELGNILVTLEGCPDPSAPAHAEASATLTRVLDAAGALCMHTAVLHPTNMQRLIATALDDGRSGISSEDRARWAGVTASLALAPDQRAQVVSLRAIFLRRMRRVVEERRAILDRLQSVSVPDRMLALQSVIAETLKVNECTVELKANLQEEHLAGMEFIGTVFKTIFTPLQKARAIVQSYPFYPDVYQIATALVSEQEAGLDGVGAGPGAEAAALINIPVAYKAY
uniref:BZIP domain-containing protein n=1 Tax=Auxenochlorella protothecoides TaxID=3075 RepID=A0A1D1ZS83_AUXPR